MIYKIQMLRGAVRSYRASADALALEETLRQVMPRRAAERTAERAVMRNVRRTEARGAAWGRLWDGVIGSGRRSHKL